MSMQVVDKVIEKKMRLLASQVGDFIRYWGFRRIHGEIWTLVYLSETPLSGKEIIDRLKVSKALVSPALKELEMEELIVRAPSENTKVKRYAANEDVMKVIKGVLKRREKPMLDKVHNSYESLSTNTLSGQNGLHSERFTKLGEMINTAQLGLQLLLDFENIELGK